VTLHALKEYIKYRWKAKTRHGIHSPFVYDLIDKVLFNKERNKENTGHITPTDIADLHTKLAGAAKKNIMLIASIISYYNSPHHPFPEKPEFLFHNAEDHKNSAREISANTSRIIIVSNIHNTLSADAKWKDLYEDPEVSLSIDLYCFGLLFFRKEFKEKQHFFLRSK
jgi:hypothetical protein